MSLTLLGSLDFQEAKRIRSLLEDRGVKLELTVQPETCGKGCKPVADVFVEEADLPKVREFFEANGGTWPVLIADTGRIAISYGVAAVPESYVIAPSGLVARKIIGGISADGIDQLLLRLGS